MIEENKYMESEASYFGKKKMIFIANVDTGQGMSGGSRIYFELLKKIPENIEVFLFGSRGTIKRLQKENVRDITFVEVDYDDNPNLYALRGVLKHFLKRFIKGMLAMRRNADIIDQADYIYSASDFYPDFFPAFYAKLKNKKIKWIAGYYLFAPAPFAKDSPYKGRNVFRGLLYWLMQRPSYYVAKHWADFVLVTSDPDVKKFVTKKRNTDKIIVVQGGVDITESEKYLQSGNIVPVEKRKYDACFVGRFHYQKGAIELVDIWKKVCGKKPEARLAMVGNESSDNPTENTVKENIKKYGLEHNIDLLGFRDGQDKYEIFKQSKMIVHPAVYDSGGMAAAEGMAWGLPGLSFDLEALKTYYPKGVIKIVPGNKEQFAENILALLEDRDLYDKISKEAHDLIIEVWDWDKRAESIFSRLFV